jgi:hypothetical protein
MEQGLKTGTLVPSGRRSPAINVSFQISQQMVQARDGNDAPRPRPVVHSISAEAGQPIELGDFDLLVGKELVRLKHVANEPEWLVLSSNATAVLRD